MSQSLTLGQKVFNQRLLAEHCLSETQASALFEELQQTYPDLGEGFNSLHDCIKSSNGQLRHLGLEIVAIAMPAKYGVVSVEDDDDENEENDDDNTMSQKSKPGPSKRSSSTPSSSASSTKILHYAMVNKFPDEIAKKTWQAAVFQPLTQQSFVKAVLERLAQEGATPRSTLLNLKNTVSGSTSSERITLASAEDALERLLSEKWIVPAKSNKKGGRRGAATSSNGSIVLGPRAFCELTYFFTDEFGVDAQEIPQQIVLL
jgi:Nse1 non-SMC component of SMC5-6 complex